MSKITVKEYLKSRGYNLADEGFFEQVTNWEEWYKGDCSSFHRYKIRTGKKTIKQQRKTLGMGKQVCEDWANILFNEHTSIIIDDDTTQTFVRDTLDRTNAYERINKKQEEKMWAGTVAYIPYADNVIVDFDTGRVIHGDGVKINYVTAPNILPLTVTNGECIECAFTSHSDIDGKCYIYLQMCVLSAGGTYDIENHLFESSKGQSESKINLDAVDEYKNIAPVYHTGCARKPFAIDTPGLANHICPDSVYGVSAFANSIPILMGIDIIFDSYINEFVLGKKRVYVGEKGCQFEDGEPVFDPNDTLYYALPGDMNDSQFLKEIDMKIRAGDHQTGLDDMMQLLSTRSGFGPDNYKYQLGRTVGAKTATEVLAQYQTKQQSREKHLKVLDRALKDLIHAIIEIGINILGLPLNRDVDIKIDHDDAIIEDRDTKITRMRNDAAAGFIKRVLYIQEAYGVSEEDALKMMPDMADLGALKQGAVI